MMRVGSMFSGIGGFDAAAERCGMTVAWQVEVDRFARRVLKHHWPGVEQHGDVRTVDPGQIGAVDILCGGWPCQGNSVAGKRGGHGDERSGLFSQILRLVDGMAPRPAFLVLENVPGLVSVNERRDFASVIGELRGRGYVGCVRVLDAQYFGLAQRRKRLLFVAGLGAAGIRAVQLVLEGGRRYPAPRRETGEGVAPTLEGRAGRSGSTNFHTSGGLVTNGTAPAKRARSNDPHREDMAAYVTYRQQALGQYAADLSADALKSRDYKDATDLIAHTLRADGFDASEDGTGRGTPLVMMTGQPKYALQARSGGGATDRFNLLAGTSVRRLTPTECERLQGFPDGWTCLCSRNEGRSWPEAEACRCPDGPRYRALGNAVAVPVAEWVLRQLVGAATQ